MNWIDEVRIKIKKKNQILFSKDSIFLQDLSDELNEQNHRVIILWSFALAHESINELKRKYPHENRPQEALIAAKDWAQGKIKMRQAQRKILDCHQFAKELDCKEDIAAVHAIGQACSVVHTAGHALGYPIYDLSSIVYKYGIEKCSPFIESRKQEYIETLFYWIHHIDDHTEPWAPFLKK